MKGYEVHRSINGGGIAFYKSVTSAGFTDTDTTGNAWYNYRVLAFDAAGNNSPLSTGSSVKTPPLPDTTPPTVTITAPTGGIVSRTITISATAQDRAGPGEVAETLAGVEFRVDGLNVGAEVTAAHYYIRFDTRSLTNGPHSITAVARDSAGNSAASVPVSITGSN